jgi:hypothetical protein
MIGRRLFNSFAAKENLVEGKKPRNTIQERRRWLIRAKPMHQWTAAQA